ncbi:acyl-CoA thioesterase [Nesterenkonia flava]|uniref:Acyl-CoA thioesterase n=1 Tax=Nesterenkonia flava TaxID=469799 RepID=A0ABU1FQR6_9MICC|nr:acyl-CoA thioesterase [Nesterenkonia flava]MDR5710995.1 acyl-CoA thioesterase [Nesterenkonia flava]
MHLILRTLLILIKARRRPPASLWEPTEITLRAMLTDVDLLRHINNGQYFSLFDLGRYDLMVRSGFWDACRRRGWYAVVQAEQVTFRRSVNLWQRFRLATRIIGVDDRCFYIEHRVVVGGEIAVRAYVAGRLIGPQGPVPMEEILNLAAEIGDPAPENFEVPEKLRRWREDFALPSSRRAVPHDWD